MVNRDARDFHLSLNRLRTPTRDAALQRARRRCLTGTYLGRSRARAQQRATPMPDRYIGRSIMVNRDARDFHLARSWMEEEGVTV